MKRFGLIGKTLSHSFSPHYFKEKFETLHIQDAVYNSYELSSIDEVVALMQGDIDGFNVTIPYKQDILTYLNDIDAAAEEIGAVNCVKKTGNGYKGYNTDWLGFLWSLKEFIGDAMDISALVLGDGGASKAVCFALRAAGIKYEIVSRKGDFLHYNDLTADKIEANRLIINTTSLGMYPAIDTLPLIPYESLTAHHYLYDLVYNPVKTHFLLKGEAHKARIKNGYDMLRIQAEESWKIWTNMGSK
jgi:shikimate dehydrogenase